MTFTSRAVKELPQLACGGAGAPDCSNPPLGFSPLGRTEDACGWGILGRAVSGAASGQSAEPASLTLDDPSAAHGCPLSVALPCSSFPHLLPQPLPADSSGTASWHRILGQDVSMGEGTGGQRKRAPLRELE